MTTVYVVRIIDPDDPHVWKYLASGGVRVPALRLATQYGAIGNAEKAARRYAAKHPSRYAIAVVKVTLTEGPAIHLAV